MRLQVFVRMQSCLASTVVASGGEGLGAETAEISCMDAVCESAAGCEGFGKTEGCCYAEFVGCAVFLGWEVVGLVHYRTG